MGIYKSFKEIIYFQLSYILQRLVTNPLSCFMIIILSQSLTIFRFLQPRWWLKLIPINSSLYKLCCIFIIWGVWLQTPLLSLTNILWIMMVDHFSFHVSFVLWYKFVYFQIYRCKGSTRSITIKEWR